MDGEPGRVERMRRYEVTDEQWKLIEPLMPPAAATGRTRIPPRTVLNGVLWILGTGAQWREMPPKYPPYQTCHRRFQQWVRTGKLERALTLLARHLHEQGQLNLDEAFVDATFASAKKGALPSAPRGAARARRSSLSPLATVFLSPLLSTALRRPSASWWNMSLPEASSMNCRQG